MTFRLCPTMMCYTAVINGVKITSGAIPSNVRVRLVAIHDGVNHVAGGMIVNDETGAQLAYAVGPDTGMSSYRPLTCHALDGVPFVGPIESTESALAMFRRADAELDAYRDAIAKIRKLVPTYHDSILDQLQSKLDSLQ